MALPSRGSLSEFPITMILGELVRGRRTGVLTVIRKKVKRSVGLEGGRVVSLSSNALSDSLGKILESAGRIEKGGSMVLRRGALEAKLPQAAYVVMEEILTLEDLERFRRVQARMRLAGVLMGGEGSFNFEERESVEVDGLIAGLSLPQESRHVLGKRLGVPELKALLGSWPLRPIKGGSYSMVEAGLSLEEIDWLKSTGGALTLEDFLASAPRGEVEGLTLLAGLQLSGLVSRDLHSESGAASAVAPKADLATSPPAPVLVTSPPAPVLVTSPPAPVLVTSPPAPVLVTSPPAAPRTTIKSTADVELAEITGEQVTPSRSTPRTPPPAPEATSEGERPSVSNRIGAEGMGVDLIGSLIAEEVGELEDEDIPDRVTPEDEAPTQRSSSLDSFDFDTSDMTEGDRALAVEFKKTWHRIKDADYYGVLEVEEDTDPEEVRKVYFRMAKSYYADRLAKRPEPLQRLGREIFDRVKEAYETLSDPAKKEEWLSSGGAKSRAAAEEAAAAKVQAVLTADAYWRNGVSMLNAGSIKGAQAAFQKAIDLYPEELEYQICLAYTQFRLNYPRNRGVWEKAERTIMEAVKKNDKLDRGYYFLGRIARAKDRPDRAKRFFAKAVKINPRNVDARKGYLAIKAEEQKEDEGMFASLFSRFKR